MKAIRVLLVDDHQLVRAAVAKQLGDMEDIEIVGEADNADDALSLAAREEPDVVVMDIDMPGLICFDAARRIRARSLKTRILFLSGFSHDSYIEQALEVEARGYITKSEPTDVLARAVREVASGGSFFSDEILRRLIQDSGGVRLAGGSTVAARLTRREHEVLRYLARGMSKKEVARTMSLSPKTVENHTSNLMAKLDIHDRVELARYAIREGLAEA